MSLKLGRHIFEIPNISLNWHRSNALDPQWLCRYRKPKHLGRAPSKRNDPDYFKKNPPTYKDITKNIKLYRNYNSLLKSLVCSFQEEIHQKNLAAQQQSSSATSMTKSFWDEKSHHAKCMAYNTAANAEMLQKRMERLQKEKEEKQEFDILYHEQSSLDAQKEEDELVKALDELSMDAKENWLTFDNMEDKISEAVDNPVNYNFAVNKIGVITSRTAQIL